MNVKVGQAHASSYRTYPDHYKFFSIHFFINQDILQTERSTYDSLGMASDIGGVLELLLVLGSFLVGGLSNLQIKALITNRLYHVSPKKW